MSKETLLDPALVQQRMQSASLADAAYQTIRDALLCGRIKPGTWLRQRDLAQELGVSQVTVREALNRLVASGLATRERYRGVKTAAISTGNREELLTLRAMLEGWAAELAALIISCADLARLRDLLPQSADLGQQTQAADADRTFHWIIINASGRPHLIHLLRYVWEAQPPRPAPEGLDSDGRIAVGRANLRAHRQLLDALEARDGNRARGIIAAHISYELRPATASPAQLSARQKAPAPRLALVAMRSPQGNNQANREDVARAGETS